MKRYSAFPKASALLEPHHQIVNVICRTLFRGLQRSSRCILQPQPTGQCDYGSEIVLCNCSCEKVSSDYRKEIVSYDYRIDLVSCKNSSKMVPSYRNGYRRRKWNECP